MITLPFESSQSFAIAVKRSIPGFISSSEESLSDETDSWRVGVVSRSDPVESVGVELFLIKVLSESLDFLTVDASSIPGKIT